MKTLTDCYDKILLFLEKLVKRLTVYDVGVIKLAAFTMGLLFASCFPKTARKFKVLCLLFSAVMMIPVLMKASKILRKVF